MTNGNMDEGIQKVFVHIEKYKYSREKNHKTFLTYLNICIVKHE